MVGEHSEILGFLLANGAQTDLANSPLIMPPLISHISHFRVQVARTLLEHGADVHYHGRFGTPLYHAANLFDRRLELMLREAGAQDVSTVSYWVGL
jgi:Ankyrin repeats (many copies)